MILEVDSQVLHFDLLCWATQLSDLARHKRSFAQHQLDISKHVTVLLPDFRSFLRQLRDIESIESDHVFDGSANQVAIVHCADVSKMGMYNLRSYVSKVDLESIVLQRNSQFLNELIPPIPVRMIVMQTVNVGVWERIQMDSVTTGDVGFNFLRERFDEVIHPSLSKWQPDGMGM